MPNAPAPDQPHRRERLAALLAHADFGGVRAELARFLGLTSGAYIRQLLQGERPITEKLVDKIEAAQGGRFKGWFEADRPRTYSPAALKVAALYDQAAPKDQRIIWAVANAALSEDSPPGTTAAEDEPEPAPTPAPPVRR